MNQKGIVIIVVTFIIAVAVCVCVYFVTSNSSEESEKESRKSSAKNETTNVIEENTVQNTTENTTENVVEAAPAENTVNTGKAKEVIDVGDYTLELGEYVGKYTEYDELTGTDKEKKMYATLYKDHIVVNGTTQFITPSQNKIYVNGTEMYEVTGNNAFTFLVGGGVYFTLKTK